MAVDANTPLANLRKELLIKYASEDSEIHQLLNTGQPVVLIRDGDESVSEQAESTERPPGSQDQVQIQSRESGIQSSSSIDGNANRMLRFKMYTYNTRSLSTEMQYFQDPLSDDAMRDRAASIKEDTAIGMFFLNAH